MWNVKNKRDAINNRGSWNHLKFIQETPEEHTGKTRNELPKTTVLGTVHMLRKVQM